MKCQFFSHLLKPPQIGATLARTSGWSDCQIIALCERDFRCM